MFKGTKSRTEPLETSPHYSDFRFDKERTVFCSDPDNLTKSDTPTIPGAHYDYSDRLSEWDYDKTKEATIVATNEGHALKTADWYQAYLSHFYDRPVTVVHIIAGVNRGNGYPYTVFGTIERK